MAFSHHFLHDIYSGLQALESTALLCYMTQFNLGFGTGGFTFGPRIYLYTYNFMCHSVTAGHPGLVVAKQV